MYHRHPRPADGTADVLIWLVAEVTSTILAACIPFYRPLVRRVARSSRKGGVRPSQDSYGLAARSNNNNNNRGHNKLGSRAEIKGGFHEASDDSSDRGIVAGSYEPSQIVRHTNIRVEFNEAPNYPRGGGGGGGEGGIMSDAGTGKRVSPSYYWGNHAR